VGTPVKRKESILLLKGLGTYGDDIELPVKMYHAAFLRSPYAHARIRSIDSTDAVKQKGVLAVFTGEDLQTITLGYWNSSPILRKPTRHPLALGKVRYNGEAVAIVVADDKYVAEDVLDLIKVKYEPLPAVVDPLRALDVDSPRAYEELPDNLIASRKYHQMDWEF
jgi:CO/xanthine dehydrogenase Mo-binding subunit